MSEAITVIYEKGVLRPLTPLQLPERSRLEIQIIGPVAEHQSEAERARRCLQEAGLIRPVTDTAPSTVSDKELTRAARALAAGGPLSELILNEREGR